MTNWDRLEKVIKYLNFNVNSFAKEIGLNRAERLYQIKRGNYAISKNLASTISEHFPNINDAWLITGEGSMLKDSSDSYYKIPLFNVSLDEFNIDLTKMTPAHELEIPILSGSDFAIVNEGEAMSPEIEHASVVFVKEVDKSAVIYGDIYLIISEHINLIRFVRGLDEKRWKLVAKNSADYDEIVIDHELIKAVYKVKGVLSMVTM
ncbi:S24 family peptidase [Sphingobacterium bovisgrunnientis]|jgi:plasmid maintenance system antidote protein VapI|uniref:S24 family peptidase n=1 Tax=Sphingobacterium bovisgrunnientis TaxID=1874697 RepID=UPI00135885E6|nr:S24 family peptidase [Sphingobacterium bovisgrunnientis]